MASALRKYKPKVQQPTLTVIQFEEAVDLTGIDKIEAGQYLAYGDGKAEVLTQAELEENFTPTKTMSPGAKKGGRKKAAPAEGAGTPEGASGSTENVASEVKTQETPAVAEGATASADAPKTTAPRRK